MTLHITKASESIQVNQLVCVVYATPGIGKSTLGFTADAPLLLDFDNGSYRAGNRGDVVQVSTWADVLNITVDDLREYHTVVVDTAGRALDALTATIISENPKLGRGGALTLQGFGELKARFIAWTKLLRSFGLDVVLVSHLDEQRSGDEIIERLDIQGGSKNEVYKAADVMGRLYLRGGKRVLNFSPTDTSFGKNPAALAPLDVPHYSDGPHFLAEVLKTVKAKLNEQSASQQETAALLADWSAKIEEAKSAEEFNALLPAVKEADSRVVANVKRLLMKAGKAKGLEFDKQRAAFVATKKAA